MSAREHIWGIPEKLKPLPKGWKYLASATSWLMAECPDGYFWYVTPTGVERSPINPHDQVNRILWPAEEEVA